MPQLTQTGLHDFLSDVCATKDDRGHIQAFYYGEHKK